ncbi:MAG: hypothetical protein AAB617_02455 [Patescibacteria group bacterium]
MLSALDTWLLRLTERFVKRFNWTTGKDNFWLAKKFCIPEALCLVFMFVAVWATSTTATINFLGVHLMLGSMIALFTYSASWIIIRVSEFMADMAAATGAMELSFQHKLLRTRKSAIIRTVVWPSIFYIFIHSFSVAAIFGVSEIFYVMIVYLISVNKPPFKRSMAVEWLRGKANELAGSLQPTPTPQPAYL